MASSPSPPEEGLLASNNLAEPESPSSSHPRQFSRSPHPYHRKGLNCPDPPLLPTDPSDRSQQHPHWPRTSSDSGTEADDESTGILKGLPAPPLRARKGLRSGWNGAAETDQWLPVLQPWPSFVRSASRSSQRSSSEEVEAGVTELRNKFSKRRRIEILRRLLEAGLLFSVGAVVLGQESARSLAWTWKKGTYRISYNSIFMLFIIAVEIPSCSICTR